MTINEGVVEERQDQWKRGCGQRIAGVVRKIKVILEKVVQSHLLSQKNVPQSRPLTY